MSIMDEGISTLWSIHAVEYYAAKKRSEALACATTWMSLEDIILSETSQSQETTHCGRMEHDCNGHRASFWGDGKVLGLDHGYGCTAL